MTKRPNIVFLFSDQQRYDTVSCYGAVPGAPLALTPCLDAMAADGVRFDLAMTCQPVCGPARACLQTGLYPDALGCTVNDRALPPDVTTVADRMNAAGYETDYVGKWHLASQNSFADPPAPDTADYKTKPIPPERRGGWRDCWLAADVLEFTSHGYGGFVYDGDGRRVGFDGYRADFLADRAIEIIRRPKEKPFFLFVSWLEPHHQNDHNRCEAPDGWAERYADYEVPADLAGTGGDWREEMPAYLACCRSLDENVGRILDALRETGQLDDTLVVYTSDHGCHFRTRNGEYKRSCHDASLHVPLIVRGPGFRGGKTVNRLTSLIDLPPTLLDAAGIAVPDSLPGHSLVPLAADPEASVRDEVLVQISEAGRGRAIRTADATYCAMLDPADGDPDLYHEAYCYDNRTDPAQRNNLAGDPAYRAEREAFRVRLAETVLREEGRRIRILEKTES